MSEYSNRNFNGYNVKKSSLARYDVMRQEVKL